MATRRSTRVTQVSPWIPGGEGQLRDLFPLPPWLFLLGRLLATSFRHWYVSVVFLLSVFLWWKGDVIWYLSFLVFPLLAYLLRSILVTAYLWYKNPTIPLFARKR